MITAESRLADRQRKRLLPWAKKAVKLVAGKLADARAHAEKAVTETLKATPDGRHSLAVIKRNPSFKSALNRLDELWTAIAGPTATSTSGLVHDAAEFFYLNGRTYWWDNTPDEFRVASADPTQAQLAYVRGLLWFGLPIRESFAPQFKRLDNTLSAALGAAGSTAGSNSEKAQITSLKTWETQARDTLIKHLGLALNDANQRADLQAMKDSILPQYLES